MSGNDSKWWDRFWARIGWGQTHLQKGERAFPFGSYTTPAGENVTPETALKLSAVWACVRLRSQTIASLPLHLRNGQNEVSRAHSLYRILHDSPNYDMAAYEYWTAMIASLDLWGNAYSEIKRRPRSDEVISLEPLNPAFMSVKRGGTGAISYIYTEKGREKAYSEANILHFRGFSLDGLVGLSPIQYASNALGGQMDANKAANQQYANGLKVGGFLKTTQGTLTAEQRERLRANLREFSSPDRAYEWLVLEGGMDPIIANGLKINAVDAQLLQSRMFGIEEICRAFGVPPALIGQTDKASSWASSLDQTNRAFLTYSLRPTMVLIEQTITKKLLSVQERTEFSPKFAAEGLLRAASQERASFYTSMLQNGVMTRNEVRKLEDLPPMPGADDLTIQLNMAPIQDIGDPKDE